MKLKYPYDLSGHHSQRGFTLIELSIVLVIIGLIIGGIMVGKDLIKVAAIRATVSQIEKYKSAVGTFKTKYNALPGDIKASEASAFGFIARAGGSGDGDGNGRIEGLASNSTNLILGGETVFFWTDLNSAGLVDGSFRDSSDALIFIAFPSSPNLFIPYLPTAKIGQSDYIFAANNITTFGLQGYGGLVFNITSPIGSAGTVVVQASLTPLEAQSIDSKIDDGMPLTGRVISAAPGQGSGASAGGGRYSIVTGITNDFCVSSATTPNLYNTLFPDSVVCSLLIAAGF